MGATASNRTRITLATNQALLVSNVHSIPGGGFELREGDTVVNSTAFNSGVAWQGLQWYQKANGDVDLVGVAGDAIGKIDYVSGSPDGIVDDVTSGLTITAGQNNLWFGFTAQDDLYFWGGPETTFDDAFKFDGTTATVVSGSAPKGKVAFFHNNRIFVIDDTNIRHSTLTDIQDFSGEGAGTAEIDANDGFKLTSYSKLNTDLILLFKENSIHQYITTQFPFPRFPLFDNVGAVGPGAVVTYNGVAYFITPEGRMKATDGSKVIDFPADMDDVWDSVNKERLKFIRGYVFEGSNHTILKWVVSSSGGQATNDLVIIWDLKKKSWWRYPTGFKMNAVTTDRETNIVYGAHYDGKIYKKNDPNKFSDDSEEGARTIGLWRWGWQTSDTLQMSKLPQRLNLSVRAENTGSLDVRYGFDFNTDQVTKIVNLQGQGLVWDTGNWDQQKWAGATDLIRNTFLFGRGTVFQVTFTNDIANPDEGMTWDQNNWDVSSWAITGNPFRINGFTLAGKVSAQKVFDAE